MSKTVWYLLGILMLALGLSAYFLGPDKAYAYAIIVFSNVLFANANIAELKEKIGKLERT